jgi:hypothetical protein
VPGFVLPQTRFNPLDAKAGAYISPPLQLATPVFDDGPYAKNDQADRPRRLQIPLRITTIPSSAEHLPAPFDDKIVCPNHEQ